MIWGSCLPITQPTGYATSKAATHMQKHISKEGNKREKEEKRMYDEATVTGPQTRNYLDKGNRFQKY